MRPPLGSIGLIAALLLASGPSRAQPADEEDAPVVTPTRLAGLEEAGVRGVLGEPALARAEGLGGVWVYRPPTCVLFVYFADEGRGLRVVGASSGPRRHGDAAPGPEACLSQAVEARGPTPLAHDAAPPVTP